MQRRLHANKLHAWLLLPDPIPSWLQTTVASRRPQLSSHTVPHAPPKHTSTRPSSVLGPFTSLTSPSAHGPARWIQVLTHNYCINRCTGIIIINKPSTCINHALGCKRIHIPEHTAPASSQCWQLWTLSTEQSNSLVWEPVQPTFSKRIVPVPSP